MTLISSSWFYVESCFTDDFFSSVNDSRFNVFGLSTSLRDGDEILLQFDMGDNSVKDGESGDSGLFFFDSDEDSGRGLRFASSFFHFIRRFWNQILMCLSVRFNMAASSILLGLEIYLLKWNSFSSSNNCPLV